MEDPRTLLCMVPIANECDVTLVAQKRLQAGIEVELIVSEAYPRRRYALHLHLRVRDDSILYEGVVMGETSMTVSKAYLKQLLPRVLRDLKTDAIYSGESK